MHTPNKSVLDILASDLSVSLVLVVVGFLVVLGFSSDDLLDVFDSILFIPQFLLLCSLFDSLILQNLPDFEGCHSAKPFLLELLVLLVGVLTLLFRDLMVHILVFDVVHLLL